MSAPDPALIAKALDWQREGRSVAIATVIATWGSAPHPVGSLLVIDAEGNFAGSVSGGCVEAEVIAQAPEVIAAGSAKTLEFGVADDKAWSLGLACGGSIRVFLAPLQAGATAPESVYANLLSDVRARRRVAFTTKLDTGESRLAHGQGEFESALALDLEDAFRRDASRLAGETDDVFINVFNPTTRLIIVGAVHVAQALVPMARALGYEVTVVDPRTAFATEERFGDAVLVCDWPDEALAGLGMDERTALIALTHDAKIDDTALIAALASRSFYVGALGSRKTHADRIARLTKAGVSSSDIERIHAPIGLDIGAQGAAEIAVSIIAEMTAVLRGKGDPR
jgi:xanthine dehydrogenase accessory factor